MSDANWKIIAVCGGRSYDDRRRVYEILDSEMPIRLLIEGGATGADYLSREWAQDRGVPFLSVDARWEKFGIRAGPIRNGIIRRAMPDKLIAFPGGDGTRDMVEGCKRDEIPVDKVDWS